MEGEQQYFSQENLNGLYEAVGDSVHGIIQTYIDTFPELVDELEQCNANGDTEGFIRVAHSLKSSSMNLGLIKLSEYNRDVEDRLNQHEDLDLNAVIVDIKNIYAASEPYLQEYLNSQ